MSDNHLDRTAGLLAMARERMRTRHLALRTEQAYLQWLQRYVDFHDGRDPYELAASEVERFLTHLTQPASCHTLRHYLSFPTM